MFRCLRHYLWTQSQHYLWTQSQRYLWTQRQWHRTINRPEDRAERKKHSTIFIERMRKGRRQSHQHQKCHQKHWRDFWETGWNRHHYVYALSQTAGLNCTTLGIVGVTCLKLWLQTCVRPTWLAVIVHWSMSNLKCTTCLKFKSPGHASQLKDLLLCTWARLVYIVQH